MLKQADYKKIYMQEASELLQEMNENLLIFEKDHKSIKAINAIFRSAHTLKSMSASMGYAKIAELSHKMEDVLEQIRSGKITITSNLMDILFKTFDNLETMTGQIQEDKEINADIAPLITAFDEILLKKEIVQEKKINKEISIDNFLRRTILRAKEDGFRCFKIKVILDESCVLKSVRAFMVFRNLHAIGEVIKSVPDSIEIEAEKFDLDFSCLCITKEEKNIVKNKVMEILEIKQVEIEEVLVEDTEEKQISDNQIQDDKQSASAFVEHMRKINSIRIDITSLDKLMNLVEELAINKLRLMEIASKIENADLKTVIEGLNRLTNDLQTEVMKARLVPIGQIFERFPRLVRDLAIKEQKRINFQILGSDIELDRTVIDVIGDPLIHLIKNSVDHGIELPEERQKIGKPEEGKIILSARRERSQIFIDFEDDGRGFDIERIKSIAINKKIITESNLSTMTKEQVLLLAAHPGITTKKEVSEISGRGVGLDVVKQKAENLGGNIFIESTFGKGTKITICLPITTALVQALIVKSSNKSFAIPISNVIEIIKIKDKDIKKIEQEETIIHRNCVLPILNLNSLINNNEKEIVSKINMVIVEFAGKRFGIIVDKLLNQHEIVIKQLPKELKGIRGLSGATILGSGSVALVLDVASLS
ncbi:chemotaxis protein CheA [Candidatus Poribacteria bacterium]|nr:chemotaxis protein CheA [Candidatus Poribacteria bacterium]